MAKLEKAGIPTVLIDFEDQIHMVKEWALAEGVPKIRFLHGGRVVPGPEDVDDWIEPMLEALTKPLTDEEKESGRWEPSRDRVLFEGTLDEAQEFYQQTKDIPRPVYAPMAVYTDGLPIIVPTEERVRAMLTGTSHQPDELITYQADITGILTGQRKKGEVVRFQPSTWRTATVEQVAINAVMAGCKPEYLPVVLAIAESGCGTSTTVFSSQWVCVSGPIAKEIGMNAGCGMLNPGNPANAAIGRAYQLMAINLGGAITGVNRMSSIGSPFNMGGCCFAEYSDGLPPGWKGLNEEFRFKKDESVVMAMITEGGIEGAQFSPGGYRAFQKSGHGGIARRLDVKGTPGPHNWLEYLLPGLWANRTGPRTFIMVHEMAQHLYEYGFKSKEAVYEWIWEKSLTPVKDYRNYSWPDLTTDGWMGIERTSGKRWKELPDDYPVPVAGNMPSENRIIISGGDEELCLEISGGPIGSNPVYSVDAWR
ncbi:MAG: hypothetical protein CL876_02070 [Dehalococcoidales bacterium]|nr:hypothetical protein [Dehalococcoidales bacterium]